MRWSGDGGLLYAQLILGGAVDPAYKKRAPAVAACAPDFLKSTDIAKVVIGLTCRP